MKIKIDTSINIDERILRRVEEYADVLHLTKTEVIFKILAHFIKRSRNGLFLKGRTVGYQGKTGNYKKVTLHLTPREVEIFRQIRVVTLLSTSYVFFIAMELFGNKIFKRAKKSQWVLKNIQNYSYSGSYPEYLQLVKKSITLFRYWLSGT
jgi:hypothetical protein